MRRLLTAGAVLVAATAFTLGPIGPAWACSCLAQTEAELYASAEVVFVGTVLTVDSGDPLLFTFEVDSVQKGDVGTPVSVSVDRFWVDDCLFEFVADEEYQIYAGVGEAGLSTGLCDGSHALGLAEAYQPQGSSDPEPRAEVAPATPNTTTREPKADGTTTAPVEAPDDADQVSTSLESISEVAADSGADESSGSSTLIALFGVLAVLGFLGGLAWRRLKST